VPAVPESAAAAEVLVFGDARLRERCRDVAADEDVTDLVRRLREAMAAHDGVGLAAPQLGDPRRVILVGDPEHPRQRPRVLINPRITDRFGPQVPFEEGCLSFPDLFLWLRRPRGVEVSYRDLGGAERRLREEGVVARICQHEVDHLDGILFIDHLPAWRRGLLALRLWRLRRQSRRAAARREVAA